MILGWQIVGPKAYEHQESGLQVSLTKEGVWTLWAERDPFKNWGDYSPYMITYPVDQLGFRETPVDNVLRLAEEKIRVWLAGQI